ncbi:MAG: methyltransferase domain-containing protein [Elusimicrobia bacterium]|nr:methyltransferase domain-containing protein [Elusimicrobiota bacterium]
MGSATELRDAQRQIWNKFSEGWKAWDAFVMAWLAPAGEAMLDLARLEPGHAVLDVATGTGEPGLSAAARLPRGSVKAVDVAEDMARAASENAARRGLGNFEALSYDGLRLPFPDRSFDAVLCRHGIIFMPDMAAAVRELARVARPGGVVVAAYWLAPERNPWASLPARVIGQTLGLTPPPPDAPGVFRCAAPGLARRLFAEAGLKDVREREVAGEVVFEGTDHFWRFLNEVVAPVASALSKADAAARDRARAALERELTACWKDGRIAFPWAAQATSGVA